MNDANRSVGSGNKKYCHVKFASGVDICHKIANFGERHHETNVLSRSITNRESKQPTPAVNVKMEDYYSDYQQLNHAHIQRQCPVKDRSNDLLQRSVKMDDAIRSVGSGNQKYCHVKSASCVDVRHKIANFGERHHETNVPSRSITNRESKQPTPAVNIDQRYTRFKLKNINILLLGESGVGKSTWINGFANYVKYATLQEAETGDGIFLIPPRFTVTDENYQMKTVSTGFDENENSKAHESSTQFPKRYRFNLGRTVVRIIDTPGLGDTGGIEKDAENFENILSHISTLYELHGICILLKPTNARLNAIFQYCIKGLLTHLHRDACRNIVFCFTKTRGTSFKPGETLPALTSLLEDGNIDIKLDKKTIYCVDNEAVRYLAGKRCGISFEKGDVDAFSCSWKVSHRAVKMMLEHFDSLNPHLVKNTKSLNDARRTIFRSAMPLAQITAQININVLAIEQRKRFIANPAIGEAKLKEFLYIPQERLEVIPLKPPLRVCTADRCSRKIAVDHRTKRIQYSCSRPSTLFNFTFRKDGNCKRCGCENKVHKKIPYELAFVRQESDVGLVEEQIDANNNTCVIINECLKKLEYECEELKREQELIQSTSVQFSIFLKQSAIAPYNDALGDYLSYLIAIETDAKNRKELERYLHNHNEEVKKIDMTDKTSNNGKKSLSPDDVDQLIQKLNRMHFFGKFFDRALAVTDEAEMREANTEEVDAIQANTVDAQMVSSRQNIQVLGLPSTYSSFHSLAPSPYRRQASRSHHIASEDYLLDRGFRLFCLCGFKKSNTS